MSPKIKSFIESKIVSLYDDGYRVLYLCKLFSIHRGTVQAVLKRNGVELRKSSPKYLFNTKFFDEYNRSSSYWAGFIAADGHIRSDRSLLHIKLSLKDIDHLDKFKKAIGFEGNVHSNHKYCYIDICGKWYPEALKVNYNIGPRKTNSIEFPEIPSRLISSYIRGYFDGDGCITVTSCPTINFTSGSISMLSSIQEIFYDNGIRIKSKNRVPPIQAGKQISYSGENAKKILDWIYKGSTETERLDRKYNRYKDFWT